MSRVEGMTVSTKKQSVEQVRAIVQPCIDAFNPMYEHAAQVGADSVLEAIEEAIDCGELVLGGSTREQLIAYGRENELLIPLVDRALGAQAALDAALAAIDAARADAEAAKRRVVEASKPRERTDDGLRFDVQHPEDV